MRIAYGWYWTILPAGRDLFQVVPSRWSRAPILFVVFFFSFSFFQTRDCRQDCNYYYHVGGRKATSNVVFPSEIHKTGGGRAASRHFRGVRRPNKSRSQRHVSAAHATSIVQLSNSIWPFPVNSRESCQQLTSQPATHSPLFTAILLFFSFSKVRSGITRSDAGGGGGGLEKFWTRQNSLEEKTKISCCCSEIKLSWSYIDKSVGTKSWFPQGFRIYFYLFIFSNKNNNLPIILYQRSGPSTTILLYVFLCVRQLLLQFN